MKLVLKLVKMLQECSQRFVKPLSRKSKNLYFDHLENNRKKKVSKTDLGSLCSIVPKLLQKMSKVMKLLLDRD
jgi:hypothetical protein